ncbi:unnamed protein product [Sympodiomycopsis kandeliae]
MSIEHPQKAIVAQSLNDRETFWRQAASEIHWHRSPDSCYGPSKRATTSQHSHAEHAKDVWFPGGELNTCFNCLDRHIYPPRHPFAAPLTPSPDTPHLAQNQDLANRVMFHHVSPLPFQKQQYTKWTYGQALEYVQTFSGVLKHRGIRKGDVVIIYMPEIPETALAILACARIGAVFSVVFGGFAPKELGKRISDSKCKIVLTASCGLEPKGPVEYKPLVEEALATCGHTPSSGVILLGRRTIVNHTPPSVDNLQNWFDWETELDLTRRGLDGRSKCWSCHPVASEDPLYVVYTSGSTGKPKGVVRTNGGNAVGLQTSIQHTFGMTKSDTIMTTSSFGWVVGISYILFGPLLLGASSVIFEGKPILPDAGIFWKTVSELGVTQLFTAPTALRAIRGADPTAALMKSPGVNLRTLRAMFVAGERSEPKLVQVFGDLLRELAAPGAIVNDDYWMSETGSPITAIMLSSAFGNLPPRPGSAGLPVPGMNVLVVSDDGKPLPPNTMGNLVLCKPLAPTCLSGLWNNPDGFQTAYWSRFKGHGDYFDTGDSAIQDSDGYITICARNDDLINVAAHRLGTGLIEQVVTDHDTVVECAVVGIKHSQKGEAPFAFVVVKSDSASTSELLKTINDHIRKEIGPIAQLTGLVLVQKLPKTRSGKTLRRTVRAMVDDLIEGRKGDQLKWPQSVPATVEDRDVLAPIFKAVEEYVKNGKLDEQESRARL